jgi:hypothetical protein
MGKISSEVTAYFLVWLLQNIAPVGGPAGQTPTNRLAAGGLAFALGVLGLAISVALPMVLPVFRFPHPSGPYEIGTLTSVARRIVVGKMLMSVLAPSLVRCGHARNV